MSLCRVKTVALMLRTGPVSPATRCSVGVMLMNTWWLMVLCLNTQWFWASLISQCGVTCVRPTYTTRSCLKLKTPLTVPSLERRSLHGAELEEGNKKAAAFVFSLFFCLFSFSNMWFGQLPRKPATAVLCGQCSWIWLQCPTTAKNKLTKTEEENKWQSFFYIFNHKSVLIFIIFTIIISSRLSVQIPEDVTNHQQTVDILFGKFLRHQRRIEHWVSLQMMSI